MDVKPYYKNPREDVMEFVPDQVRRHLDVGCGAGAFGAAIKQAKGAEVWGIEAVEEMAKVAEPQLDKVFAGDVFEILPSLPEGHFDLVSFNDVLEHLAWPDKALEMTKRVLAPDGQVLASIPNIRYWDAFLEIWKNKDFPYQDFGIFDRTHLRFYTEKSARRLFEEAGYQIVKMKGINPTPSRKLRMMNAVTGGKYDDMRFLQFLILARVAK
jgi:2-polyprenyl-3-methyl-5-hydroxy-6-metoxy-1,4-benzoquinol methylase